LTSTGILANVGFYLTIFSFLGLGSFGTFGFRLIFSLASFCFKFKLGIFNLQLPHLSSIKYFLKIMISVVPIPKIIKNRMKVTKKMTVSFQLVSPAE